METTSPATTSAGGRLRLTKRSLFDRAIVRPALADSVHKLHPRVQARSPVMFVVGAGAVLTTIVFFRDIGRSTRPENVFNACVATFLWFTMLFANFAEAMAEGRGKAQAASLRKVQSETMAKRRGTTGEIENRALHHRHQPILLQ